MGRTVLLYGATGHSGALIAAEAARQGLGRPPADSGPSDPDWRMILAGRNAEALKPPAERLHMERRVFGLEDPEAVRRQLAGIDVVLNAAGPFAATALPLARAALAVGAHYVDVNGELDVYQRLDDLGFTAERLGLVVVCGAGHTAAASDVLLSEALAALAAGRRKTRGETGTEFGAVRIALTQPEGFSLGSALTAARSLREQVTVIRKGMTRDAQGVRRPAMVKWHEAVGRLERAFDFGDLTVDGGRAESRVAAAANLVDTLTAQRTLGRFECTARTVESYVEMNAAMRAAYYGAAAISVLNALPGVAAWTRRGLGALLPPPGRAEPPSRKRPAVVLQIEGVFREPLVEWRLQTPHFYDLTAQLAVAVARKTPLAEAGWRTPGEVLGPQNLQPCSGALHGCELTRVIG